MKLSINLLQQTQRVQTKLKRLGLLLQTVSVVVLVGFAAIVFVVFSYSVLVSSQKNRTQDKIEQTKNTIKNLREVESQHKLVWDKLNLISRTVTTNDIEYERLVMLYNFAREKISLESVSLGEDSKRVNVSLAAEDLLEVVKFFEDLVLLSLDETIDTITSQGVSFDKESGFKMQLEVAYEEVDGG